MSNQSIQNLVFDFGGVLFPVEPYSGSPTTPEERTIIRNAIQSIVQRHQEALRRGDFTVSQFKDEFQLVRGISLERMRIVIQSTCELDLAILELIRHYKSKYQIYGLINASAGWTELRQGLHKLDNLFTRIVVSHEIAVRKPSPEIFHHFLQVTDRRAKACLFIDNEEDNITAAKSLGFQTHLYQNPSKLRDYLELLS